MSKSDEFYAGFDKPVLRVPRIGNMQDAYEQGRREGRERIIVVVEDCKQAGKICLEGYPGDALYLGWVAACDDILAALKEPKV